MCKCWFFVVNKKSKDDKEKKKNYFHMYFIKWLLMWLIAKHLSTSQGEEKMDFTSKIVPRGSKYLNLPS